MNDQVRNFQQSLPAVNGQKNPRNGGKRASDDGLSNYVFGRVQPQAVPLEEAILGALMLDREIFDVVSDILRPETFYIESHQKIYRAIQTLRAGGNPVDLLTVTEQMRKEGTLDSIGGGYYLVELSHRVASAANAEFHSRIVQQKYMSRMLIEICTRAIRDAYEDTTDILQLLDLHEMALTAIRIWDTANSKTLAQSCADFLRDIELRSMSVDGLIGVPCGMIDIDRKLGGFQKTDFVVVAARPGMGKTGWAVCAMLNAAMMGHPVGMFSCEMSAGQIIGRMAAVDGQINSEKMRTGKLEDYEWQTLQNSIERISQLPIYIDETAAIDLFDLKSKARRMVTRHGVEMIIVDYLQLVTLNGEQAKGRNREQIISEIAKGLKALAKELKIGVIALSQLSRAVEIRGGSKRPQLSDLRESGSIEQESDIVAFIYRPEYYQILEDENGQSLAGVCEFIIAKHRHGEPEPVKIRFVKQYAQFCDWDDFNIPPDPNNRRTFTGSVVHYSEPQQNEDLPF